MKTFVIGDIHGAFLALCQCLERASFNSDEDRLVVLGDVCDVYPQTRECIDLLLSLKHLEYIIGNHDLWALEWAQLGAKPNVWLRNGGEATISSYGSSAMPQTHRDLLNNGRLFLELDGRLFLHAGFDPGSSIKDQGVNILAWDREVVLKAFKAYQSASPILFANYRDILVGHTPTQSFGLNVPSCFGNLWLMDTGAGWAGRLSIMDVETKQYWQSDSVHDLYNIKGR